MLLESFPYKDAGHNVYPRVHGSTQTPDEGRQGFSSDELLDFARHNHSFESVVGTSDDPVLYKDGAGVEWLYRADMTPGSFEFFGMPALYSRVLQPADYKPRAAPVFVLRSKTWNAQVMAFTLVLAGLTPLIFGLVPALQAARRDLNNSLRDTGRGVIGGFRTARMRDAAVVMEVAV